MPGRHKFFLSFHRDDQLAMEQFISKLADAADAFIMAESGQAIDLINSNETGYVIKEIKSRFIQNSTVTIVLVGNCTWARRFVDWEVQASLRQPGNGLPDELFAILIDPNVRQGRLPDRVRLNNEPGYAKFQTYPSYASRLRDWIDDAHCHEPLAPAAFRTLVLA